MARVPPRKNAPVKTLKVKVQNRHHGPLGKAKILSPEQFDRAANTALQNALFGTRDQLFVLLSRFCGLRANEIAHLHIEDITDAEGKFIDRINVSKRGAKYGKERVVHMRPEVVEALQAYVASTGIDTGPIFWTYRGEPMTSNAVQKQIKAAYSACGFKGARSHSGRRYAITTMAQKANTIGASLQDVSLFAGHANLSTTARYIDASPHAPKMIEFL